MERISNANFKEYVQGSKGYVLVSFLSLKFLPSFHLKRSLEELEKDFLEIKFYYVDILKDSKLCLDQNVATLPTMILYKDGIVLNTFKGEASKDEIKDFLSI